MPRFAPALLMLIAPLHALAEPAAQPAPLQRAAAFDEAFFKAFNACDLKTLTTLVAPDLEFFHDFNGTMRGRAAFLSSVERNVCGKFTREAVGASMEGWPLGKEGVVYSGTHRFCQGRGVCQGQGRYLHILVEQEGRLVLSRVVSYDHRPLGP